MDLSRQYYLLLIDIQGSTSLPAAVRSQVFDVLTQELRRLNETVEPKPVRSLQLSYGDEVAGLFDSPNGFYSIVSSLRDALFGFSRIRFVAVCGYAGVASEDIRQVGGDIFKRAGAMMDELKRSRGFCRWALGSELQDQVLTSLTGMSNLLLENMTSYQYEVYGLLKTGVAQTEISAKLQKHRQSVSDAAKRGGAREVLLAEASIQSVLSKLDKKTGGVL